MELDESDGVIDQALLELVASLQLRINEFAERIEVAVGDDL